MHKIIEFILVTDPPTLKEKLEQMVNRGWEIKGFVTFNSGTSYNESYAVMESYSESEPAKMAEFEEQLPMASETVLPKSPRKKEPSISLGNN